MPYTSKKNLYFDKIKGRYDNGMSLAEASEPFDVNYVHVMKWFKAEGIKIRKAATHRRESPSIHTVVCLYCKKAFTSNRPGAKFCSRDCTNTWQREGGRKGNPKICKCGESFTPWNETHKYCSKECANKYQDRRQKNPDRYVTFNCETCGVEVKQRTI